MYNELEDNKMGNSTVESWSNTIASVELLWIYSVESQIGIWTTSNGSVNPFLTFFLLPKKDSEANENETRPKINWSGCCTQLMLHPVFS